MIRSRTGLPPATYFSGAKIQWILDNVPGRPRGGGARRSGVRQSRHLGDLEPDRRPGRRRARHRRHQRQPDDADGPADAASGTTSCCAIFDIPRAMLPAIRSSSDRAAFGVTRRDGPVGGEVPVAGDLGDQQAATVGQVCIRPGRGEEHLRHRQLHAAQHRHADRPVEGRAADDGVLPDGRRDDLRARGIDRGHRLRGAVAARSARDHRVGVGDRGAGELGARQRRHLFRAGVLGTVRAVLALRRARRDRRPVALQHQGAPRARHARSDLLPDARRARRDGRRTRASASKCSRSTAAPPSTTR